MFKNENYSYILDIDNEVFVYDYTLNRFVLDYEYEKMYGKQLSIEELKEQVDKLNIHKECWELLEQYYDEEENMTLEKVILSKGV